MIQQGSQVEREYFYTVLLANIDAKTNLKFCLDDVVELIFKISHFGYFQKWYFHFIRYYLDRDMDQDANTLAQKPCPWPDEEHKATIADLFRFHSQKKNISKDLAEVLIKYFMNKKMPLISNQIAAKIEDVNLRITYKCAIMIQDLENKISSPFWLPRVDENEDNLVIKMAAKHFFSKRDFYNGIIALLEMAPSSNKKESLYNAFKKIIIPFGSTKDRQSIFSYISLLDDVQRKEIISLVLKASFQKNETKTILDTIKTLSDQILKFEILNIYAEIGFDRVLFEHEKLRDAFFEEIIRSFFEVNKPKEALEIVIKAGTLSGFLYLADCHILNNQLEQAFQVCEALKKTLENTDISFNFQEINMNSDSQEATIKFTWEFRGTEKSVEFNCVTDPKVVGRIHYMIWHADYQLEVFDKMTKKADSIQDLSKKIEMYSKITALNLALNRAKAVHLEKRSLDKDVDSLSYLTILKRRTRTNLLPK